MTSQITFYDIPSTHPGNAWNAHTFKTRYALNFKGIPYKTEWVDYPDIEPLCKNLGIPPTSKNADGSDRYTLPAIHDPSTGVYISDSMLIAEYLEKTYPDTPQLFPHHTIALQTMFEVAFGGSLDALWSFIILATSAKLRPRGAEYYRRTREKAFGKPIEDIAPTGDAAIAQWAKFKDGLGKVDEWYAKSGGDGPFLLGETPSWGDIIVVSYLVWLRTTWGEDSSQWKDISSWNGGRWARIVEALKRYETIV